MVDVDVDFILEQEEPIEAEFEIEPDVTYTADIVMSSTSMFHDDLYNRDLPDQHPMSAITGLEDALESKVDKTDEGSKVYGTDENGDQTTYDLDSFGKVDDVQVGGVSVVTNKIAELGTMAGETASDYSTKAVADTLYADISYEGTIDNHIADKNNPHAVTKTQVGLGNCDNTSDADKPVSTATQTALNGKQDTISDLSTIRENAQHGESAYNTISGYGDIVTHNTSEFATSAQGTLADTALQPNDNISELNNDVGYITSSAIPTNYVTTDTAQTITPQKAFTSPLVVADGVGVASGTILSNKKILQKTSSGVEVGNSTEDILLVGKSTTTNPKYNGNDLALKSDIPTMTAGTGIDITSNTVSVADPTLVNNGTGTKALAVGKTSQSTAEGGVAVGYGAQANSTYGTAVGYESRASNTNTTVIGKGAKATQARAIAIGSGAEANAQDAIAIKGINNTANTFQVYTYNMLDMSTGLIPDARISSTYATVNYVNDQVSTNTAYFDGSWATYADIPSTVAGFTNENLPSPTNNNYLVVLTDETQDGGTWRYKYIDDGNGYDKANWAVEYQVNETPLTQTQWDAINSGVTSADVALAQSALQSGDNISVLNNDAGYITSSALPTVNDATLTIQKNGTDVATFTANSATNQTANITVPTDTSDLTNGAGYITGVDWGDVGGLLSDQTDLQTALNNKQDYLTSANAGNEITISDLHLTSSSGSESVTVNDGVAGEIGYVKVFGGTSQTGTATLTSPIYPTCNNGVLGVSKNLALKIINCQISANICFIVNDAPVTSPYTPTGNYVGIGFPMPVIAGESYTRSGTCDARYCHVSFYEKYSDMTDRTKAISDINISNITTFTAPAGAHWGLVTYVQGEIADINFSDLQAEHGSTATAYVPAGIITTTGTIETVSDSLSNTATASYLLKIGDKVDSQDLISGAINRNVGVKVLDGSETTSWTVQTNRAFTMKSNIGLSNAPSNTTIMCSHSTNSSTTINSYGNVLLYGDLSGNSISSVDDWNAYLASQYANGTPVVLIYPLTNETTESVAGQTLTMQDGTNTIQITQASISNLGLELGYYIKGINVISFTDSQHFAAGANRINGAPISNSVTSFFGVSTSGAATVQKEVSIPSIKTLDTGTLIIVQPTTTSTVADSTLKLNDFPAYPMRYNGAAITTSTDSMCWASTYPSFFVFDGTYWVFMGHGVDTNTTYTLNSLIDAGRLKAGTGSYAITRYSIIAEKPDGTWEKITATNADYSVATTKSVNTSGFLLNHLKYYYSTGTVSSGNLIAANTGYAQSPSINFAYSSNCGETTTWALGAPVFLVGTLGADGLFYLDTTTWWSTAYPTTNDGKLYIHLGYVTAANASTITFQSKRSIYYYDTQLREYIVGEDDVKQALGYTPVNPSSLATVATSGDYDDLLNKPSIPAAQVNSDWNAVSGVAEILNKPTIPTVDQTYDGSSANAQSGVAIAGAGFLTGITSGDVTGALGYTPLQSSDISNMVTTDTAQSITAQKTFSVDDNTKLQVKDSRITRSTISTTDLFGQQIQFLDSNNDILATMGVTVSSSGRTEARMIAQNHAGTDTASIYVGYDASDNPVTYCVASDVANAILTNKSLSTSSTYTRLTLGNGVKIAAEYISGINGQTEYTWSYGITFTEEPMVVITRRGLSASTSDVVAWTRGAAGTSSCKIYSASLSSGNTYNVYAIAIGH